MSANPYDQFPWHDPRYDTVITTTTIAAGIEAAARAAAQAAAIAAAQDAVNHARILSAARAAAQGEFQRSAPAENYQRYESGIFDKAAALLSPISNVAAEVGGAAKGVAQSVLQTASATGIGALFGSGGTVILLGAGALMLFVLFRR